MKRRSFMRHSLTATSAAMMFNGAVASPATSATEKPFNLKFAPHDGMFSTSAKTFLDQIQFMYDQGFRAVEDNGLLKRPKEEQDKIGALLSKLGMTLGVFVVDGGDNWKVSLTTGKQEF